MSVLFIDACFRDGSRTKELADLLLQKIGGEQKHLFLPDLGLKPLDKERLKERDALLASGDLDNPFFDLANEFAAAETIVIAAPYYDLGFPAILKTYLENIYVIGITSSYSETGRPVGICKAKTLYYVTTSGGPYDPHFGFDYIKTLAEQCFGIEKVHLIKAECLDVFGSDVDKIMEASKQSIRDLLSKNT